MNKSMYEFINSEYEFLFKDYCKFNKNVIKNSKTREDLFNDKILFFMETDIEEPTLDLLKLFLRSKNIKVTASNLIEYKDITTIDENNEMENNIKLLFINYRPENKK